MPDRQATEESQIVIVTRERDEARYALGVLVDTAHGLILKLNYATANHGSTTAKESNHA